MNPKPSPESKSPKPHDKSASKSAVEILRQKIIELIEKNPTKAATILTTWLKQKKP